ncbi:MAG TPA: protein kinase [Gemmatimonadales bacterium]|jgi:serine/threonine-protein kinase
MVDSTSTALSGALADRYTIERELGAGGMATVYLAHDIKHDRKVAIKVLRPELAAVIGAERFLSEIKTTANLQHPHILSLFDSGTVDGTVFYVMPFVDGESLRDRLAREKQLPIADAVRIASETADALQYAHQHGVIHRDIKPENILLHGGHALVADFGIALAASKTGGARMTETGMSLGTPQYMSPEQAMGERELDARTDVYALGCTTYEMLTGEPPFTGPTAQAIVAKVMTAEPVDAATLRKSIPADVADAVHTAMQKLPADRFASAAEFAAALQGQGGPQRTTTMRAAARPAARPGGLVAALAGAVVVLAALLLWQRGRSPAAISVGSVRFVVTGDSIGRPVASQSWPAIVSPDGKELLYAGATGDGSYALFLRPVDDLAAHMIPGTEHALQPVFSPDGRWIAFEADGKIKKVSLDGGAAVALGSDNAGDGMAWTSRGIVVATGDHGLKLLPVSGGAFQPLTRVTDTARDTHIWPIVLDDGTTLLFSVWHGGNAANTPIEEASVTNGVTRPVGVNGVRALGMVGNVLIYLQLDGNVMAVPLDRRSWHASGTPVPLLDSIPICQTCNGDAPITLNTRGDVAYMRGAEHFTLWWSGADGPVRQIVPDPRFYLHPRLSPDGKRIAVEITNAGLHDIWVLDVATATLTRMTHSGNNTQPEWTADGSHLVFLQTTDSTAGAAVAEQPTNFLGDATVIAPSVPERTDAIPTPDGHSILTFDRASLVTRLVIHRIGDSIAATWDAVHGQVFDGQFSPDGHFFAYISDESGAFEAYLRTWPDSSAKVQVSSGGAAEMRWSPDGRTLYYVSGNKLIGATITTTPALAVTSRKDAATGLFSVGAYSSANFDVGHDGNQFLTLRPADRNLGLVVGLHWDASVRARLAGNGSP